MLRSISLGSGSGQHGGQLDLASAGVAAAGAGRRPASHPPARAVLESSERKAVTRRTRMPSVFRGPDDYKIRHWSEAKQQHVDSALTIEQEFCFDTLGFLLL